MPIPAKAVKIEQVFDPYDVDFIDLDVTRGAEDPHPLLAEGETIAAFRLDLPPESIAAGLEIKSSMPYPNPVFFGETTLRFYFGIVDEMQNDPLFDKSTLLAVVLSITTSASPPRRRQRTAVLEFVNQ